MRKIRLTSFLPGVRKTEIAELREEIRELRERIETLETRKNPGTGKKALICLNNHLLQRGITPGEISAKTGMSEIRVSRILSGRQPFSERTASAMGSALGLNPKFLLSGEGKLLANGGRGTRDRKTDKRIEAHYLNRFGD